MVDFFILTMQASKGALGSGSDGQASSSLSLRGFREKQSSSSSRELRPRLPRTTTSTSRTGFGSRKRSPPPRGMGNVMVAEQAEERGLPPAGAVDRTPGA